MAQGVVHGVTGHHGRNQEEVEGELEQEVERQKEEDAQTPVRVTMTMDEMERHCEALSQCDSVNILDDSSTNGAQCAQCCAVISSVWVTSVTLLLTFISMCVGCAIVKGDHAPDCGVAQEVIHGVVKHHGRNQEEVEEELEQEVEGQEEEDNSNTSAHDYDHG